MPLTRKQTKGINKSLRYLEQWWRKFNKRVYKDITYSNGYDEFLERTRPYTTDNILKTEGVADKISENVVNATDFSKLNNRELVKQTIYNATHELIVGVGDDLRYELRVIASKGYDLGLHPRDLAPLIAQRDLSSLYIVPGENTFTEEEWNQLSPEEQMNYTFNSNLRVMSPEQRSRTIARTETKRAQTIVNYTKANNEGATGFQVICRSDCCPYCAEVYHDLEDYQGTETKESLLTDGVTFSMDDIDVLPPFHPNCRCSAVFKYK